MSKYNSPNQTGLCIELGKVDHSKDIIKWRKWVADPMFDFFRYQAARFGFFVDQNAPWRIIANISSPIMAQVMAEYDTNKEDLFTTHYGKAMHEDVIQMRFYATVGWNLLAQVTPVITIPTIKNCGMIGAEPTTRRTFNAFSGRSSISIEDVIENIGMFYWLKQYLITRLGEVRPTRKINDAQISRIAKSASYIDIALDFFAALRYINNYVKKFMVPMSGTKFVNKLIDFADPEILKDPVNLDSFVSREPSSTSQISDIETQGGLPGAGGGGGMGGY
jgi:hypothetical protein